jgi:hypothetical protein
VQLPGPRREQVPLPSPERVLGSIAEQGTKPATRQVVIDRLGRARPVLGYLGVPARPAAHREAGG